jgi:hypothetical protein
MVLENLDRTQWSFDDALAHVETVVVAHRAVAASRLPLPPPRHQNPWEPQADPQVKWKAEAHEQLMVALRDGDLHAQGRYTEERPHSWGNSGTGFSLHSGYHTGIRPEQWREARYFNGKLTAMFWEFIDIRVPRFMVLAIWPPFAPPAPATTKQATYTTPYLQLMQAAIAHFGISETCQDKKEAIVEWLMAKDVEGEPISRNLADAMATLIRLPSSQRGGAKRIPVPEFSRAS